MKKTVVIFLIIIIGILLLGGTVNAAEQASLSVDTSATSVSAGNSVDVGLSITNNSISDGIALVIGVLDLNTDVFEIKTLDFDEEAEKLEGMMKIILQNFKDSDMKLAYADNNWCIFVVEESGHYGFTGMTFSEAVAAGTAEKEIGSISFTVKSSALNQKTKIGFTNIQVSGDITNFNSSSSSNDVDLDNLPTLEDAYTESITIGSSGGYEEIEELGGDTENTNTGNTSTGNSESGKTNIGTLDSGNSNKSSSSKDGATVNTQADSDTPYTGVEDLIPVFVVTALIGLFGYIRYRKYQGI